MSILLTLRSQPIMIIPHEALKTIRNNLQPPSASYTNYDLSSSWGIHIRCGKILKAAVCSSKLYRDYNHQLIFRKKMPTEYEDCARGDILFLELRTWTYPSNVRLEQFCWECIHVEGREDRRWGYSTMLELALMQQDSYQIPSHIKKKNNVMIHWIYRQYSQGAWWIITLADLQSEPDHPFP